MMATTTQLPCAVRDLLSREAVGEHLRQQVLSVDAVPTPLAAWNRSCRDDGGGVGLARTWHVVIAGNTGVGKTLAGLNCAATAIECGERVAYISLEMSRTQVTTRLLAMLTRTEVYRLERGEGFDPMTAREVAEQMDEIRECTGGAFWANDTPIYEIHDITDVMARLHAEKGCRFFVVDYLQLAAARDAKSLFEQVSNISNAVREFAVRHSVVTLGLSQLNRQASTNYSDKPMVQGLMATSSLENDADQVVLLDHSRHKKDGHTARTWALLGKNRHGPQVEIPIEWNYRTLRVREALPDEEGGWPG